jgi:hypothetical protein
MKFPPMQLIHADPQRTKSVFQEESGALYWLSDASSRSDLCILLHLLFNIVAIASALSVPATSVRIRSEPCFEKQ